MTSPTPDQIVARLLDRYEGTVIKRTWGEQSIFYNPGGRLPSGVYFTTIKERDGPNDSASNLDRPDVFRLNVGIGKHAFLPLFGPPPARPGKGQTIEGPWDFTTLDTLTPHPVYGWISWVAILNPSAARLEEYAPLLDAAYAKAVATFEKRSY